MDSCLKQDKVNSYLFINGVEIYKFKAKNFEINAAPLCLGNVSKDFSVGNMRKTGLHGYIYDFSVDYSRFFTFTARSFGQSLASNSEGRIKYVSLNNWLD